MRDLLTDIHSWQRDGDPVALATVIRTWRSAPRESGAAMAVTRGLRFSGSVSGGCVENAVVSEADGVLRDGRPRLLRFGVDDETAWSVGLSCGGSIEVWVERLPASGKDSWWSAAADALAADKGGVLARRIDPERPEYHLLESDGADAATANLPADALRRSWRHREAAIAEWAGDTWFLLPLPPRRRLIIIGATHLAAALLPHAAALGYHTTVIDPRPAFARAERFPVAPDVLASTAPADALADIPITEETHAVLLSHNREIDDPALLALLASPAGYIGALGSRRTHASRMDRLREAGIPEADIKRIHGPVGLAIGARTPAEIAVSIAAELVATRRMAGRETR